MDLRVLMALGVICIWQCNEILMVSGNAFFKVEHKFKGGNRTLKELRAHDVRRHGRMLDAVDLPLGGNGQPSDAGLYFTKIKIGKPPKEYHVQIDTGSDVLWINCEGCEKCPKKSGLGIKLNLYDPKGSSTANLVNCDDSQCTMIYQGTLSGCQPDMLCQYEVTYGDGSTTSGYFVEDNFHYDSVSGNLQTTSGNGSIVFGCGAKQSGQLITADEALDGIMGFGQANSSVLSQLAASGKVQKMFSHCLDNKKGGGIFSIGHVVEPKMNHTPLIPNQAHYNVVMKSIEVDGEIVELDTDTSGSDRGAIIDSGTTLAYLPDDVYDKIVNTILAKQPQLQLHTVEDQFKCFQYSGKIDDGFPHVIFRFANSLTLTVYPHEYFFPLAEGENKWCVGWMNSGLQSRDGKDVTILGDIVLSGKVVFYDLVNQTIGWTEYNCSSSIKVKDSESGAVCTNTYDLSGQRGSSSYLHTFWPWAYFSVLALAAIS
ncbi:aspartic proteinase-like protein 2 isoform X2 [Chenopodium quinoa]|uniref:aspartic proteinase-like protein 2 isoform X2 n=1 Tax=Chenopodium quinoa TaxID=63459 RepID=UPI000B77F84E|nr:aspartic proteinase-like protein 2 isoform X2 [Chenopodium quinoa]